MFGLAASMCGLGQAVISVFVSVFVSVCVDFCKNLYACGRARIDDITSMYGQ